jgi:Flp pilus assembly protein TadG
MTRISRLRDESGFSLVFVGLGFMGFLAASMLAIDVGMLMTARSQAQNSADAGALAGATAIAFDSWTDRSASGPAVTSAITTAQKNSVMGAQVSVTPPDVEFPNDPVDGSPDRVKVTVYRTASRGNPVATLIAQYFGIRTADILATATAEASSANAMTCVKPFTIPDKWKDTCTVAGELCPPPSYFNTNDTFERYYTTGNKKGQVMPNPDVYIPAYDANGNPDPNYTGYNNESNRGARMTLHASNGANIAPSMYYSLAMTGDTGGDDYRWNIANCNHTIYHWNDPLVQEPGDKEGPTIDGITELIAKDPGAYWDSNCNCVMGSSYGDRQSPRIFPIPLFDPDYYQAGQTNGRVASLRTANWIGYFVEYIGGTTIYGRIIPIGGIRDVTSTAPPNSAFPKAIRLVQ